MAISACNDKINSQRRELVEHGSALFPIACYCVDMPEIFIPLHWHEELEIAIIASGSLTISADGERTALHCGEGFFWNANVLHGAWEIGSEGCRVQTVVFHPRLVGAGIDSIFWQRYVKPVLENASLKFLPLSPEVDWQREALSAAASAWDCCLHEPAGYELRVRDALSRFMELLCAHCPSGEARPAARELRRAARARQMVDFIHASFAEPISSADIAACAAISESECVRCFRSMFGTPPMRYLRQYRVQKAAEMLTDTSLTAAEIGSLCGFQDQSYFTRSFREHLGQTPAEYRRRQSRLDAAGTPVLE